MAQSETVGTRDGSAPTRAIDRRRALASRILGAAWAALPADSPLELVLVDDATADHTSAVRVVKRGPDAVGGLLWPPSADTLGEAYLRGRWPRAATPSAMVAGLTERSPGSFRSAAVAIVAFGVAFGYLEAAVVVCLPSRGRGVGREAWRRHLGADAVDSAIAVGKAPLIKADRAAEAGGAVPALVGNPDTWNRPANDGEP